MPPISSRDPAPPWDTVSDPRGGGAQSSVYRHRRSQYRPRPARSHPDARIRRPLTDPCRQPAGSGVGIRSFRSAAMDLTGHHSNPSGPLEVLLEGRSDDRVERPAAKDRADGGAAERAGGFANRVQAPATRLGTGGGPPCPRGAERADAGSRRAWRRRGCPRRASAVGVGQEVPELERDWRLAAVRSGGSRSVRREPRDDRRRRYRTRSKAGLSRPHGDTLGSPPEQERGRGSRRLSLARESGSSAASESQVPTSSNVTVVEDCSPMTDSSMTTGTEPGARDASRPSNAPTAQGRRHVPW